MQHRLDPLLRSARLDGPRVGIISTLYSLAVFLPGIAVAVRRLHDTGRSGWMLLLGLIPCIGALVLIFFMCEDSHGSNQYGEPPKLEA